MAASGRVTVLSVARPRGRRMSGDRFLYQGYQLQAIDKKGRIAIPNRLREALNNNTGGGPRTLFIGDETGLPCMVAYDEPWSKLLKARQEADFARAQDQGKDIARARDELNNFGNIDEVQFDDAGRFILPRYVIDELGLTDFAYFAGAGDVFHIWNPRRLITDPNVPEGTRKRCAFEMKEKGLSA
jgi:MraZ protein